MTKPARDARRRGFQRVQSVSIPPSRTRLLVPLALAVGLGGFAALPLPQASTRLTWSILGAAVALALFVAAVARWRRGHTLTFDVALRPQHYVQACAHSSILLYWGWYWRPVYAMAPLLAAQLVFAFAFDMLLTWSRRDAYQLGFGPFPIVLSTNLFLWFKPEWFFLQFLMLALGFAAKELIRWERDGRRVHIFNPSSFPLAIVSLGLILTGTTSMTFGEEIAITQFNPPHMYVLLFLVALPGQYLFGVTTMTMSAVVTTYVWGLAYFWATGTYFFIDSFIPIAVFLGMHLLFTDPSTAPRSESGRIAFGILYGLGNVILYALFGALGVPKFYDKLLPVPLMNLSVRAIDRVVPRLVGRFDPARLGRALAPRRRNLAYVSLWTTIFVAMSALQGVGDNHPGHKTPFWLNACRADLHGGCTGLGVILNQYCNEGSGWACNERGVLRVGGKLPGAVNASDDFNRGCGLSFGAACRNALTARVNPSFIPLSAEPQLNDYPTILQLGKGPLPDKTPLELYTRACDQGWMSGCHELAGLFLQGKGVPRDPARAATELGKACAGGLAVACSNLGLMHYQGDGVPGDKAKGLGYLEKACTLGMKGACEWLASAREDPPTGGTQ